MEYKEFINKIKAAEIDINPQVYRSDIAEKLFIKGDYKKPRTDFICQYWEVGGVSGGSCWETSDPQPYHTNEDRPKTFNELDAILELIYPQIGFLQYKHIESMVVYDEATEYEYYGNRTDYEYRWLDLKLLYAYVVECMERNKA
jgi:hypothetical protein